MNEQNEIRLLVAVYSISQISLSEYGLLNKRGQPLKLPRKFKTQKNVDALYLYEWATEKVVDIQEFKLQSIGREINEMAQSLSDSYMMNKYLFMLFILDNYLVEQSSGLDKNLMEPKVKRLISIMREEIKSINGTTREEIIMDSQQQWVQICGIFLTTK